MEYARFSLALVGTLQALAILRQLHVPGRALANDTN